MKKNIFFFVALFFLGQYVFSQDAAQVKFAVKLSNFQSISVNNNQTQVSINLVSQTDFLEGKTSLLPNHIKVMSSSEYQVKVTASSQLIGSSSSIPINTISVVPSHGKGGAAASKIQYNEVMLSTGNQTLIQSMNGHLGRSFNIAYTVSGGEEYINQPVGNYKTTITYSILPI